jgi:hypothetical protein
VVNNKTAAMSFTAHPNERPEEGPANHDSTQSPDASHPVTSAAQQVVSRQRVEDHGEVYTAQREVNAMLDMVGAEVSRIEARVLEPACGHGNFLAEVLQRKLVTIQERYGKSQVEFERYAILSVGSIYGIDILEDNVKACRLRLQAQFVATYRQLFPKTLKVACVARVENILQLNIVWGDALSFLSMADPGQPIVFSEWTAAPGHMLKQRDFSFHGLVTHQEIASLPLFSDMGEQVYIPSPVKDHPLMPFLKASNG